MDALAYPGNVLASQTTFRTVMNAMARPGTKHALTTNSAPAPLMPAAAALVRSLADYETPVWYDDSFTAEARDWVRFHTGAPVARQPHEAAFALIAATDGMPPLTAFALGTEDYPDRSATVIVQIPQFDGTQFVLAGPGIKDEQMFAAAGLPDNFLDQMETNRGLFPRGVDLVLVASNEIVALPRTVRLSVREN